MKVTAIFDVLSHWCLAAWPAFEAARAELGDDRGFYTRGSRAYQMTLHADWYEDARTTTLWANAAVIAASRLGAGLATSSRAAMRAAMEEGALLGRRDVAVEVIARAASVDAHALDRMIESAEVGRSLNDANAALARWQCSERPS